MRIEQDTEENTVVLTLDRREARLLRVALERATFVDTRPEDQEAAYRLADAMVDTLSRLESSQGPEDGSGPAGTER